MTLTDADRDAITRALAELGRWPLPEGATLDARRTGESLLRASGWRDLGRGFWRHPGTSVGQRALVDAVLCEVERVTASADRDRI